MTHFKVNACTFWESLLWCCYIW